MVGRYELGYWTERSSRYGPAALAKAHAPANTDVEGNAMSPVFVDDYTSTCEFRSWSAVCCKARFRQFSTRESKLETYRLGCLPNGAPIGVPLLRVDLIRGFQKLSDSDTGCLSVWESDQSLQGRRAGDESDLWRKSKYGKSRVLLFLVRKVT